MPTPTLPAPRTPDPMDAPPLRWGILGAGWIAATFCDALRTGTRQQVQAVGSRSPERAHSFAAANGVPFAHGSYEDLVADRAVDVVYIATPHSEHREHALLALDAGKPVLVEKAFARNAGEARAIIERARERDLFCMEAMWTRFLPHMDVARQAVRSGLLGEVRTVTADHGQALYPGGPQRLSDPALAGGALLDLGIYPVSFAWDLLGPFDRIHADGMLTDLGVDAQDAITAARSDRDILAQLGCTMLAKTPTTAAICGTKARIEVDGDFYLPNRVRLYTGTDQDEAVDVYEGADGPDTPPHRGMRFEAAEVARRIHAGETSAPLMTPAQTQEIMTVLDEVRAQLGVVFPGE